MNNLEIYGYICTAVVVISFLSKNITTLRFLNTIGCIMFGIYGYLMHAPPIIVINFFVSIVHVYHLIKIFKKHGTL